MYHMNCETKQIEATANATKLLADFNASARRIRTLEYQDVLARTPKKKSKYESDIAAESQNAAQILRDFARQTRDPRVRTDFALLQQDWSRYTTQDAQLL